MSNKLNNSWLEYYNTIKGQNWPTVSTEDDIQNLPKHILGDIIFNFLKTNTSNIQKLSDVKLEKIDNSQYYDQVVSLDLNAVFKVNDIKVFYSPGLDGGGTRFGRRYPHVIREIYGDKLFKNCFEWCSGPGFIGFELLSENICDNLFLADIYQPALAAINKTVINLPDKYHNKVHSVQIKGITDLPADWKFDLVVANPPHWNHNTGAFVTNFTFRDRVCQDLDWNLHREFFNHIVPHLNENAVILLQEQSYASGPNMFRSMIEEAGLKLKDCYYETDSCTYYYIEVTK